MSKLLSYFCKTAKREAASRDYSRASVALELAYIRERLAEIKSQHDPLASLLEATLSERDRLYAAAFYVVVGRFPEGISIPSSKFPALAPEKGE